MDILNFISWIKGGRVVTSVNPSQTLIPVGLKDTRRDDDYLAGAISVEDLAAQIGASGYKVYSALLTQSSSGDPIAIVLEDTINQPLNWYRSSNGIYYAESYGTWTLNKTAMTVGPFPDASNGAYVQTKIDSEDQAYVIVKDITGTEVDDSLSLTFVEIRVYN